MSHSLLHWLGGLGAWSYIPVFFLVFAEGGLLLLLPGETVVLLAGVLASQGVLQLPLVMVVAVGSAVLGDATGYLLGRGPARRRFIAKGRLLFIRSADVARVKHLVDRHGGLAVIGARFVGLLRTAAPFACGLSGVPPERFFPFNVPACLVWGLGVSFLGYLGGNAWEKWHHWIGRGSLAIGVVVLVVGYAMGKLHRKRRE